MSAAKKKKDARVTEIRNAKAFHQYFVGEKFEAGLVLKGTEIKSIREGKAQISEAFVRVDRGEAILYHAHVDEYAFGNVHNHNPVRPRKLLLHKKEIYRLQAALEQKGQSIIPLRIYFKAALAKIEIAVCTGKKLHDKREDLKKKADLREADRYLKRSLKT